MLDSSIRIKGFDAVLSWFINRTVAFSEIVPHLHWLALFCFVTFEKICKRGNQMLEKFMVTLDGFSYRHRDLEGGLPGFYRDDGIHLLDLLALIRFNLDLQTIIETAVAAFLVLI